MKKNVMLCLLGLCSGLMAHAQFQKLQVVEVENEGAVPGKTYRVYAVLSNERDIIDAVFGDAESELRVESTTSFYQDPEGADISRELQRNRVQASKTLPYDSWVTIGYADNYMNQMMALSGDTQMQTQGSMFDNFSSGGAIVTTNGAWFATPDQRQTLAGPEKRVLLMQLTSDGDIIGNLNLHGRYLLGTETVKTQTQPIRDSTVYKYKELKVRNVALEIRN